MLTLTKLNYVIQKIFQAEVIWNYQYYEIWNFGKQAKLSEVKNRSTIDTHLLWKNIAMEVFQSNVTH